MDSRKDLEREADVLGIPWTFTTTDKDLAELIRLRKESTMSQDVPSCFGEVWEGVGQSVCMGCSIKEPCLHKFALGKLKAAREGLADKVTIEALCTITQVGSAEAIIAACEYAARHGEPPLSVGAPKKQPVAAPPPAAIPPPPEAEVAAESIPPPPMDWDGDVENRGRLKYADPPTETEVPTAAPQAKETPVTKSEPKKRAKKAKKAPPVSHPQKAGSVQRASDPVTKQAKRSARPATAPVSEEPRQTWGEETWEARHQRERQRVKDFAALTPGMRLKPTYKGERYLVEVDNSGYRFQGKRYPTLYAVMVEILGTYRGEAPGDRYRTPTWSAPKFFKKAIREVLTRK